MSDSKPINLSAQSSALVIVDMQVEGCERHGPGLKPVIKNIRALLDRFRAVHGKVIHVLSVRPKDHPEFTYFKNPYSLLEDTPAVEFVDELKPLPNEVIVKKYSHDCFYKTKMDAALESVGIQPCRDTVVVTGIGANNCVYHAVIGFHVRNYWVVVPDDCTHASREEGYAFAVSQFRSGAYKYNVSVTRSNLIELQ
jgi:nicotinamidase-related amidase